MQIEVWGAVGMEYGGGNLGGGAMVGHVRGGGAILCWCRPVVKDYGRHGVYVFHREWVNPKEERDATEAG